MPWHNDPGYIYLIRLLESEDLDKCSCKIGKTIKVPRRESEIGLVLPHPIELLHVIPVSSMTWAEHQFHDMFQEFHRRGEWFMLSSEAIAWFCSFTAYEPPVIW